MGAKWIIATLSSSLQRKKKCSSRLLDAIPEKFDKGWLILEISDNADDDLCFCSFHRLCVCLVRLVWQAPSASCTGSSNDDSLSNHDRSIEIKADHQQRVLSPTKMQKPVVVEDDVQYQPQGTQSHHQWTITLRREEIRNDDDRESIDNEWIVINRAPWWLSSWVVPATRPRYSAGVELRTLRPQVVIKRDRGGAGTTSDILVLLDRCNHEIGDGDKEDPVVDSSPSFRVGDIKLLDARKFGERLRDARREFEGLLRLGRRRARTAEERLENLRACRTQMTLMGDEVIRRDMELYSLAVSSWQDGAAEQRIVPPLQMMNMDDDNAGKQTSSAREEIWLVDSSDDSGADGNRGRTHVKLCFSPSSSASSSASGTNEWIGVSISTEVKQTEEKTDPVHDLVHFIPPLETPIDVNVEDDDGQNDGGRVCVGYGPVPHVLRGPAYRSVGSVPEIYKNWPFDGLWMGFKFHPPWMAYEVRGFAKIQKLAKDYRHGRELLWLGLDRSESSMKDIEIGEVPSQEETMLGEYFSMLPKDERENVLRGDRWKAKMRRGEMTVTDDKVSVLVNKKVYQIRGMQNGIWRWRRKARGHDTVEVHVKWVPDGRVDTETTSEDDDDDDGDEDDENNFDYPPLVDTVELASLYKSLACLSDLIPAELRWLVAENLAKGRGCGILPGPHLSVITESGMHGATGGEAAWPGSVLKLTQDPLKVQPHFVELHTVPLTEGFQLGMMQSGAVAAKKDSGRFVELKFTGLAG